MSWKPGSLGSAVRGPCGAVTAPSSDTRAGTLPVLTPGPLPPNPGEVAASQSVADALRKLAASDADGASIDTPPMLPFGDAGSLAPSVDGVLVTVRTDKARRPASEESREALDSMPCRKVGLVVAGERLDHAKHASHSEFARELQE